MTAWAKSIVSCRIITWWCAWLNLMQSNTRLLWARKLRGKLFLIELFRNNLNRHSTPNSYSASPLLIAIKVIRTRGRTLIISIRRSRSWRKHQCTNISAQRSNAGESQNRHRFKLKTSSWRTSTWTSFASFWRTEICSRVWIWGEISLLMKAPPKLLTGWWTMIRY